MKLRSFSPIFLFLIASPALAAPPVKPAAAPTPTPAISGTEALKEEDQKNKILKPGTLASSGKFGFKSPNIDQVMDGSAPGGEGSPVTAAVKHIGSDKCSTVITNNDAKNSYSVSIEVTKQEGTGGGSKKTFSATLGPKKSVDRDFSCTPQDNFAVALKSGKMLKAAK